MNTTNKALLIIGMESKDYLAKQIDISRPTLDTRLEKSNWKKGEKVLVDKLYFSLVH